MESEESSDDDSGVIILEETGVDGNFVTFDRKEDAQTVSIICYRK